MLTVQPLGHDELARVEPLVSQYPFKPYRHYRVLPRKAQGQVMLAEIAATLRHSDGFVLHGRSGDAEALAVARTLAWDTAFFGVAMGRIEYFWASRPELLAPALDAALQQFRHRGVLHVSARADVADIDQVVVLESARLSADGLAGDLHHPARQGASERCP